ncbi:MAG: AAA family ATPase, partial [Akkermansia sp.]
VDLEIHKGEIFGIGGLAGQGKLGIPNGIMGMFHTEGEIRINGKELKLTNASSGLQSLTPLFVMIKYLTGGIFKKKYSNVEDAVLKDHLEQVVQEFFPSRERCRKVVNGIMELHHTDMFIEEPEAHLFPSTQKEFVYVLADLLNGRRKHTCVIATHSPYLMTAFNNLIQAGETASESEENNQKVAERFSVKRRLRFDDVAAFSMKDGKAESIMDDDFKMISAEDLDSASQEISDDFNFLLEV